jgi:PhzF family phenazine biosynthesis protein
LGQAIVQIDAFTDRPFSGNPAAVCLMNEPGDETWMRKVAQEMNLSETAFLYPYEDGYHLRWLTPKAEVDLCGHATLATAHFLYEDGLAAPEEPVRFFTRSGWVSVSKDGPWLQLHFPTRPPQQIKPPRALLDALGLEAEFVGTYPGGYFVVAETDMAVRTVDPDMKALEQLAQPKCCVTAADSTGHADFISRLFAPALGIPEDPVNGNSHTALTPYWAERLGKRRLLARQASARGGELRLTLTDEGVIIAGQAVTVLRGQLAF